MKTKSEISSDDLRSERTWLLQHGCKDFMDNGMSAMEAQHAMAAQVEELSQKIDRMERRTK